MFNAFFIGFGVRGIWGCVSGRVSLAWEKMERGKDMRTTLCAAIATIAMCSMPAQAQRNESPSAVWNLPANRDMPSAPHNMPGGDLSSRPWNRPGGSDDDLSPDERAAYGLQPNPVAGDFSPKPYKKKSWLDD